MKITDINNQFAKNKYIEAEFVEIEKECYWLNTVLSGQR